MQHLETLWKVINAAGTVRDIAQETKTLQFTVTSQTTFYLHVEYAAVTIAHHHATTIEVDAALQAGFGWRLHSDQDEAGVYVVAKRRAIVGGVSRGKFVIRIPHGTYLALRLEHCSLTLDEVNTTLQLPTLLDDYPSYK